MDKESKLEEEILASFERGEWQPVSKNKSEIARYAAMASASLAKDKRVNIRISSRDLDDIQARAAEEAIPYQTLMASVLHKYVTGRLVEPQASLIPRSSGPRPKRRASYLHLAAGSSGGIKSGAPPNLSVGIYAY